VNTEFLALLENRFGSRFPRVYSCHPAIWSPTAGSISSAICSWKDNAPAPGLVVVVAKP
jgi:hypothetical protein